MYDIVTIGDSTMDMFLEIDQATLDCDLNTNECKLCFNYAEKIPIAGAHQSIGGNAANVAVGAQKLGLKAAIVSQVGHDLNGAVIEDELNEQHVDTHYLHSDKGRETRYAVVLNYKGERTILSYHAPRVYKLPKLPATKTMYYTSLGKTFERIQDGIIKYKKKNPTTLLACNPGSYQCGEGIKKTCEILPYTDILFVNKEEAQKLTQKKSDIKELLRALHIKGVKTAVVTDGSNGSYVSEGSDAYFMPALPVKPISRTGAGDAYASGFLVARIHRRHTLETAMRWGTANASSVVQQFGGQLGLLTSKQIEKLLKKYSSVEPKLLP